MRNLSVSLWATGLGFVLVSCGINSDITPGSDNNPPGAFSVNVAEVTSTYAIIDWGISEDPDGDAVTYTIELDISPIEDGDPTRATFLTRRSWKLAGLRSNEAYSGRVIAVDENDGRTSSPYSFMTRE